MATRIMPDQAHLRECFDYDAATGAVTWRVRPREHFATKRAWNTWNSRFPGKSASSSRHKFGHAQICLGAQNWLAHRLIWKWMTGEDPVQIDHRKDATDNAWENLRASDHSGNMRNRRRLTEHGTGFKGVYRSNGTKSRYSATIRIDGKHTHLGNFATPEEAHAAYCEAARKHFGEFWNPG